MSAGVDVFVALRHGRSDGYVQALSVNAGTGNRAPVHTAAPNRDTTLNAAGAS